MTSTLSGDVLSPMLSNARHYLYENVKKWFQESLKKQEENKVKKLYPEKDQNAREAYEDDARDKYKKPSKSNPKNKAKSKTPTNAPSAKQSTQGKTVYDETIGPKQSSNDNSANQEVYGPAMPRGRSDFILDPFQYIVEDPDINQNGNINDKTFGDGAIAATLTTLDQGTEEVFKYGVGKKSGWYKYNTYKMGTITSIIDYNINLQEQRINCPDCDNRVNQIVAGVQTAVGNGLSGVGAVAGGLGGPVGSVGGAVTVSTIYSTYGNDHVGELARPIAQYIVEKYDNLMEKNKNL
jgi:hypothetical protein